MRSFLRLCTLGLPILLAACGERSPVAYGEASSIIFGATDSLWAEVGDTVYSVLEPRILTVRDERTFELTQTAPEDPQWEKLRLFRQLLVVGRAEDPWIAPVVASRAEPLPALPTILERDDVWARGQRVTAVVLPPDGGASELVSLLPELHRRLDERFRAYALERMYVSGRDDSLRDVLRASAGFALLLPKVYRERQLDERTYFFRNDNMAGGEQTRTVLVTWRDGAAEPTPNALLAWRDSIAAVHYQGYPQASGRERIETRPIEKLGGRGLEVQGVWQGSHSGFPIAGPFITRAIICPAQDRTYLVDAWLFAPARAKYEFMLQLETILDSFECGA